MDVRKPALPAINTVMMRRHEDARSAVLVRALAAQPFDLAVIADLVVLQHRHLDLLVLVLELLGLRVRLLLPLLPATQRARERGHGRTVDEAEVGQRCSVRGAGQVARAGYQARGGPGSRAQIADGGRGEDGEIAGDTAQEELRGSHGGCWARKRGEKVSGRSSEGLTVRPKLKVARGWQELQTGPWRCGRCGGQDGRDLA